MMTYKLNDYIEKFSNNTFYNNAIVDSEIPSFIIENDFQKRLTETMKILYGNYPVNTVVEYVLIYILSIHTNIKNYMN